MTVGIVSVAFNGYGRFLPRWLRSLEAQYVAPAHVTLVLGEQHGAALHLIPSWVEVCFAPGTSLGLLKNAGIAATPTEGVMPLSIDDELLPWAIQEFERYHGDVLVPDYVVTVDGASALRCPRTRPADILSPDYCCTVLPTNYFHGASPFKRSLWEAHPYQDSDCANALFWIDVALQNPSFTHIPIPCMTYNRWTGSHSSVTTPQRAERAALIRNYRKEERYEKTLSL